VVASPFGIAAVAAVVALAALGVCSSALAQGQIESRPGAVAAPQLKRTPPAKRPPAAAQPGIPPGLIAPRDTRRPPGVPLQITGVSVLPQARQRKSYSHVLTASGGTAPYAWSVTDGRLPAGLTLSPAGVLAGTPKIAGKFSFTVRVSDSTPRRRGTRTENFTLMIGKAETPAVPASTSSPQIVAKTITVEKRLSATGFTATQPMVPKTITVETRLSATGFTATQPVVPKTITVGTPLSATGF
jgi:hypothetical protein